MEERKETTNEQRNRQRITAKILWLITEYSAKTLTLTFNDKTLKRTTEEQRREIVKRYLRNQSAYYIANIDYGEENGREHYHALIVVSTLKENDLKRLRDKEEILKHRNKINLNAWRKYGNINIKSVWFTWNEKQTPKATAKRLYEHATKETTKGQSALIFSRTEPSKAEQIKRTRKIIEDIKRAKAERMKELYGEPKPLTNEEIMAEDMEDYNRYLRYLKKHGKI